MKKVISPGGSPMSSPTFETRMSYDASGNLEYFGRADAGTAVDAPYWLITKNLYDASGNLVGVTFAGRRPSFTSVWNDRATYSYAS
jgi:YD repeat-containing protein